MTIELPNGAIYDTEKVYVDQSPGAWEYAAGVMGATAPATASAEPCLGGTRPTARVWADLPNGLKVTNTVVYKPGTAFSANFLEVEKNDYTITEII